LEPGNFITSILKIMFFNNFQLNLKHQEDAVLVPRECACSPEVAPLIYVSTSPAVEVVLEAHEMGPHLDYDDIMVEGRFEFIATPACTRSRKVAGPSGDIRFRSPSITNDEVRPISSSKNIY